MKNLIFYLCIFFFLAGISVSCYKKWIPNFDSTTEVTYIPDDSITFNELPRPKGTGYHRSSISQ